MGEISFKSVGTTRKERQENALDSTSLPIGIKTPLQPGGDEGIFKMNYNLPDQIHDNIRNLLLTNWGERLGLYDFGANLRPLLSEYVSQDSFDAQAVERISAAVSRWMPYVSLENFLSEVDRNANTSSGGTAVVRLTITYSIPTLNVVNRALEVTMYVL